MENELKKVCKTKVQQKRVEKVMKGIQVIKSYHTYINTIIITLDEYIDRKQVQEFIKSLNDKKIMYNIHHNAIAID